MADKFEVYQSSGPEPSALDQTIAQRIVEKYESDARPRLGDFVDFPDGTTGRLCYRHRPGLQWTDGRFGESFFISPTGRIEFSGGLNDMIPNERLERTGESRPGAFWFWHNGQMGAHMGVGLRTACRVYRVKP